MAAGRGQRAPIDLPCSLRHETDKAYLRDFGLDKPVWIPKSMCQYHREGRNIRGASAEEHVTMEEWYAKEKDLI